MCDTFITNHKLRLLECITSIETKHIIYLGHFPTISTVPILSLAYLRKYAVTDPS